MGYKLRVVLTIVMCIKESSIVLIILFFLTSSVSFQIDFQPQFVGVKSYIQGLRQEEEGGGGETGAFCPGPHFLGAPGSRKIIWILN